jgi:hypothetical protein
MIVGDMNIACILDMRSMGIRMENSSRNDTMNVISKYPEKNISIALNDNVMLASTGFVNGSNRGYFVTF